MSQKCLNMVRVIEYETAIMGVPLFMSLAILVYLWQFIYKKLPINVLGLKDTHVRTRSLWLPNYDCVHFKNAITETLNRGKNPLNFVKQWGLLQELIVLFYVELFLSESHVRGKRSTYVFSDSILAVIRAYGFWLFLLKWHVHML